jgi:hypothetical protein
MNIEAVPHTVTVMHELYYEKAGTNLETPHVVAYKLAGFGRFMDEFTFARISSNVGPCQADWSN